MKRINHIRKTVVLQIDETDCGVACLLSIIRYFGGDTTIEHLRDISGTGKTGTTLLGLYEAALDMGLIAEGCELDINTLVEYGKPVILHCIKNETFTHYIVCYGGDGESFMIFDPAQGLISYTREDLQKVWHSHYCLMLEPTEQFVINKIKKSRKRKWVIDLIKDDKEILWVSIFLGLIVSVLGITTAIFAQKLVDELIPNREYMKLYISLVLLFVLLIIRIVLSSIRNYMLNMQSRNFCNRIIALFYRKLLALPQFFFDTRKTGELVTRLNDTQRIQKVLTSFVGDFIINGLMAIVVLSALFYYSWQIGVLLILSIPVFLILIYKYNEPIMKSQQNVMVSYANSETYFINTVQGIATIKNLNKQKDFAQLNRKIYGNYQNQVFNIGLLNIKLSGIAGVLNVLFLIVIIAIGCILIFTDKMKLGEMMAVISLVNSVIHAISDIPLIMIPLNEAKVACNRMYEIMERTSEADYNDENERFIQIESLDIKNLTFRFPGRKPLYENLNLSLKKGEITFIIGESGCGKSTLCHLLDRSYRPISGKFVINDALDIMVWSLNRWRDRIGVMPQDVFIFNGTVYENILIGKDRQLSDKDILKYLDTIGISNYINKLPQGYMTKVGEEGINLSGGQRQMIGLLRLLVKNPDILILDEPTAAMDHNMELFVLELLTKIKKDKIVIFISHKLHILKKYADMIYLLKKGRIVASGTHKSMMFSDNSYSSFWTSLQS